MQFFENKQCALSHTEGTDLILQPKNIIFKTFRVMPILAFKLEDLLYSLRIEYITTVKTVNYTVFPLKICCL
jgi:hypothetical protein